MCLQLTKTATISCLPILAAYGQKGTLKKLSTRVIWQMKLHESSYAAAQAVAAVVCSASHFEELQARLGTSVPAPQQADCSGLLCTHS